MKRPPDPGDFLSGLDLVTLIGHLLPVRRVAGRTEFADSGIETLSLLDIVGLGSVGNGGSTLLGVLRGVHGVLRLKRRPEVFRFLEKRLQFGGIGSRGRADA